MTEPFEIFEIDGSGACAMVTETDSQLQMLETDHRDYFSGVPGHPGEMYARWGADNQMPYHIMDLVEADEVTSENKFINTLTCYAGGLRLRRSDGQPVSDPEVRRWLLRNRPAPYFLNQVTDIKYFFFSAVVFILSRDRKRINAIVHKESCHCRLGKARKGGIPYLYYANWRDFEPRQVERIPLLDLRDPYGDLMRRTGREPGRGGRGAESGHKYAMLVRFPTVGVQYYPRPPWTSIFQGGSYLEKRLIQAGKLTKLRNHASVKYQVEVVRDYWKRICEEERITDNQKKLERINEEKKHIRDFLSGIENSGKVWISGYYVDPNGREVRDVRITLIDRQKEGGDWNEDVQAVANTLCYADAVHPNLFGAVPGKSQTNNSGSDKRELFTMKQAVEVSFHDLLLEPLQLVFAFNGWDVEPYVPMIQLTTLDEHLDAKTVEPSI